MPQKIGFTRWYDTLPELSQAVRKLEHADPGHRKIICDYVIAMHEDYGHSNTHEDYGLKKLGAQKVLGLMKSKSKRRWYDQEPHVHKAFNTLYVMDESLRYEAAIRVLICLEALIQHEKQFYQAIKEELMPPDETSIRRRFETSQRSLVKTIFYQPTPELLKKIQIVRPERQAQKTLPGFHAEVASKIAELPAKESALSADHIIDDNTGMKVGGVQLPHTPNGLI